VFWSLKDSLLGFRYFNEHWDFLCNPSVIPLDRAANLYLRLNIKYISSIWAYTILIVATSHLFDFMRIVIYDLTLTLTLRGCDLECFKPNDRFPLLLSSQFISWSNKDWHIEIYDSLWLDWFIGLNIHLPFSITSSTLTLRLPLALLWCMV
jgi:hypothetical protein